MDKCKPLVIGTGTQLFAMVLFVFMLALVGVFYPYNRGALLTACIVLYALTSGRGLHSSTFQLKLSRS